MFKKFLARFGKGAAAVDLRFENRPYEANETVQGEVIIQGGEVEQSINQLAVRLMMSVGTKQGTVTREVKVIPLCGAFVILPKEQKIIPFTYTIPTDLPVSRGTVSYYFDTHLDIEGGVDRTDLDRLTIDVPTDVRTVFQALGRLGLREKPTSGKLDQYGQEFSFFPTTLFAGEISEVELRIAREEEDLRIWMEVDCRQGLREVEAKRELVLEAELLQNEERVAAVLERYITEAAEQPHAYAHPFSFTSYHPRHGYHSPFGGMLGGMVVGILGFELLDEMFDVFDTEELLEGAEEPDGGDDGGFDFGGDDF